MTRPSARHVLPEMTERTSSGPRTQDPYSKLLEERIVLLGTQVDDTSANDVMAQFMYLEHKDPDRDISLYVNSPGGSYSAMTAIYDTMRYVGCDVETICLGPGRCDGGGAARGGDAGQAVRAAGRPDRAPPARAHRAGGGAGQ
ncbi:ATP-dependent Clp endopeptidase proteolytic subunit ClpP [Streptomyces sp. SAI-170]